MDEFNNNKIVLEKITFIQNSNLLFQPIDLHLKSGDMLIIKGKNGSGKTTLLNIISGLTAPSFGTVCWNNQNIHELNYFNHLHYIGHLNGLKPQLTVLENLKLLLLLHKEKRHDNFAKVIDDFSLRSFLNLPISKLSQGQQRRVALAKLLLIRKPLWLLDEPLNALDIAMQALLQTMINEHRQHNGMVIVSSHQELNHISHVTFKVILS